MKFKWEKIEENTYRARVPAGWVIKITDENGGGFRTNANSTIVFVSDPGWQWDINDTE